MWTRSDVPSFKSGNNRYQIYIESKTHPKYRSIVLIHRNEVKNLLEIILADKSLYKDLLEKFSTGFWFDHDSETEARIRVFVDIESCKKAFEWLGLSEKVFVDALHDISQFSLAITESDQPQNISRFFFPASLSTTATKTAVDANVTEEKKLTKLTPTKKYAYKTEQNIVKIDESFFAICVTPNERVFLFDDKTISAIDITTGLSIFQIDKMCHESTMRYTEKILCVQSRNNSLIIDLATLTVLCELPFVLQSPISINNQLVGISNNKYWIIELDNFILKPIKTYFDKVLTHTLLPDNRLVVFSKSPPYENIAMQIFEKKENDWEHVMLASIGSEFASIITSNSLAIALSLQKIAILSRETDRLIILDIENKRRKTWDPPLIILDIENSRIKTWNLPDTLRFNNWNPQACKFSSTMLVGYSKGHICFFDINTGILIKGYEDWKYHFKQVTALSDGKLITIKNNWRNNMGSVKFIRPPIKIESYINYPNIDIMQYLMQFLIAAQTFRPSLYFLVLEYCNFGVANDELNTFKMVKEVNTEKSLTASVEMIQRGEHPIFSAPVVPAKRENVELFFGELKRKISSVFCC